MQPHLYSHASSPPPVEHQAFSSAENLSIKHMPGADAVMNIIYRNAEPGTSSQ